MSFGIGEILLVLALVILFFGAKRIPIIAKGLGEGIRNFQTSLKEETRDDSLPPGEEDEQRKGQDHDGP